MEDDFSTVIKKKLVNVQEKIKNQNVKVLNPQYHSRRLSEALQAAVGAVNVTDGEQVVVEQLVEILNKAPTYVANGFTEALQEVAFLKHELGVWASVNSEWQNFETRILEDKKKKEELKAAIVSGEVEERNTKTKRDPGVHPGPTIGTIREAKAELKAELEETEPKAELEESDS